MAKATTMGPMKIKESASYRVFKVFNAIILTLISVAMLYPFLYLVAQSFSSTQAIVAGQVGLIPKDFNISTYKYVITDGKFIPYYGNTIVYSIIGTVCALLFSALLAYPLSKAELYGGKAINKFIIFTMYFSGGMIPNYILMFSLGLRDTVAMMGLDRGMAMRQNTPHKSRPSISPASSSSRGRVRKKERIRMT